MSSDGETLQMPAMPALMDLSGRTAVVTGGARGIGAAICWRLAEAGANVVVSDLDVAAASSRAEELVRCHGVRAVGRRLDVTKEAEVHQLALEVAQSFHRLDIWVNNAGIFPNLDALTVGRDDFQSVFEVNVLGTQFGMAAAARQMTSVGHGGVIINIASTAAFRGAGPYSASKWAVRGLTHGIAPILGPQGIRVVALAPTVTSTPGMDAWLALTAAASDDVARRTRAAVPLGRMGRPDDIARMAAFVASDAADFMTGVTLPVDGGSLTVIP